MKIIQNIIGFICLGILVFSCVNLTKFNENINAEEGPFEPNVLDSIEEVKSVEAQKTPYQSIDFLREKTDIHNQGILDKPIVEAIKKYYHDFYLKEVTSLGNEGVTYKELPMVEKKEDSVISLRYRYQENYKGEKLDLWMNHCIIPI